MRCVIFDIDGTLSDPSHRLHHVTGGNRRYDRFFAELGDDGVHDDIRRLLLIIEATADAIVLCTGRPENYRETTEAWLLSHGIIYAELYMRPAGDTRPDHIVKMQLLDGIREDGYEPWLVVDDRPSVVAAWREAGLTCLQCRDWNEPPEVKPGPLTIMVGPAGAGKTSWLAGPEAGALGIKPSHIVSSDQIREDICGDFRDQSRNDQVFAALHAQVRARIRNGLPAVVDATNIKRKDRLAVAALSPGGPVRYIVIDRPWAEKQLTGSWRGQVNDRKGKPFDLVAKHAETFKSQLRDILKGDGLPNVEVIDRRVQADSARRAA